MANFLTDREQAFLVFLSAIMLALGAVSVPDGYPKWVTIALFLLGAFGFALKEALGSAPAQAIAPVQSPASNIDPGFSVAEAKAAGFAVFTNPNLKGGYVLLLSGIYTDIYGKVLGSAAPAGTGQQV